ncbi:hypothetical protein EI94DRAFT_1710343 [Lactarius quietus]|nr:hypothetical protein EI94DRAFT_1710343 [Lactarius quietus]
MQATHKLQSGLVRISAPKREIERNIRQAHLRYNGISISDKSDLANAKVLRHSRDVQPTWLKDPGDVEGAEGWFDIRVLSVNKDTMRGDEGKGCKGIVERFLGERAISEHKCNENNKVTGQWVTKGLRTESQQRAQQRTISICVTHLHPMKKNQMLPTWPKDIPDLSTELLLLQTDIAENPFPESTTPRQTPVMERYHGTLPRPRSSPKVKRCRSRQSRKEQKNKLPLTDPDVLSLPEPAVFLHDEVLTPQTQPAVIDLTGDD